MVIYYVLTGETRNAALMTVMVEEGEYTDSSGPDEYFPPGTTNIENHGTVEVGGEAVDMLPNVLSE